MTQVKLWQIVSQTTNGIVFSDSNGNLITLPQGAPGQVLVINAQGVPEWVANTALSTALEAKTDVTHALTTAKAYADAQIAALVDNAPVALNTLNELAVKLNGEDSAINALLLQVDGKAEKTEVVTSIAQAKQDAIQTSQGYTDNAIGNVQSNVDSLIAGASGDMITYADQTANAKADAAKSEAILIANDFATQSIAAALTTASDDASDKAVIAKREAIAAANAYTDDAIINAVNAGSGNAEQLANDARDAAISMSTQNIAQAKTAAVSEANAYADNEISDLPGRLFARTTATACFVRSSNGIDPLAGAPLQSFAEVTGANLAPGTALTPKLLFVNGLAMSSDWTSENGTLNDAKVKFGGQLAQRAFDGSDNAIMVLCEYATDSVIYAVPKPIDAPPQLPQP